MRMGGFATGKVNGVLQKTLSLHHTNFAGFGSRSGFRKWAVGGVSMGKRFRRRLRLPGPFLRRIFDR